MSQYRICEFSSELFRGFQYKFDIDTVTSIDEIVGLAVSSLRSILDENRLEALTERIDKAHWGIHSYTFEDIQKHYKPTDKIWICEHCANCI
jgi:hypothetical protein